MNRDGSDWCQAHCKTGYTKTTWRTSTATATESTYGHFTLGTPRAVRAIKLDTEANLKALIYGLLIRAKAADDLEKKEPDVDIASEINRRADRVAAITAAKLRLKQRQREADAAEGALRTTSAKPAQGRQAQERAQKRNLDVPKVSDQECFTGRQQRHGAPTLTSIALRSSPVISVHQGRPRPRMPQVVRDDSIR